MSEYLRPGRWAWPGMGSEAERGALERLRVAGRPSPTDWRPSGRAGIECRSVINERVEEGAAWVRKMGLEENVVDARSVQLGDETGAAARCRGIYTRHTVEEPSAACGATGAFERKRHRVGAWPVQTPNAAGAP